MKLFSLLRTAAISTAVCLAGLFGAANAQVLDTLDAHYTVCAGNVAAPTRVAGLGFRAGTTGNQTFTAVGGGTSSGYVGEHGIQFDAPDDGIVRKIKGVYVWFSPETEQVGEADIFYVRVYVGFGGQYFNIGYQPFELGQILQSGSPSMAHNDPYDFPGNYIAFNEPVNSAGDMLVTIETKNQFSDDTLAFWYTNDVSCGDHDWRIRMYSAGHADLGDVRTFNNFYGLTKGNPVILPVIETESCDISIEFADVFDVSCFGSADGSLNGLSFTGGTEPYTYDVYDENMNLVSVDNYDALVAGSYTVHFADDAGCDATQSFDVGQPDVLSVTGSPSSATPGNADGAITVFVTGGTEPYSYVLNSGTPQSSNYIDLLAAGLYLVTVTDFQGCSQQIEVTVTSDAIEVWPGDATQDGVVDELDYYITAACYGTGTARTVQGITWQAYDAAELWGISSNFQGNMINVVYIDANGDGTINLFDVAATIVNRGLSN